MLSNGIRHTLSRKHLPAVAIIAVVPAIVAGVALAVQDNTR